MEDFKRLSALARPLDLDYPSNTFILIFSSIAFLFYGILAYIGSRSIVGALMFGVKSFASIFLTWALARELDPDQPLTAGFAALGQSIVIWMIGVPSLLLALWAVFSFRILNRTTGLKAGPMDALLVTTVSLWLGYQFSWLIPGASGVIFLADAVMEDPQRRHAIPGLITTGASIYFLLSDYTLWTGYSNYPLKLGIIAIISLGYFFVINESGDIESYADATGELLYGPRVQLTQSIALILAILVPLWSGVYGFHQSVTFWSVLGASILTLTMDVLRP